MQFDGKRCRLLLRSVHEDDSGCYTCKLSTAKGTLPVHSTELQPENHSAKLSVIPSKEPLFTRKLDLLEVLEGRSARFDCKVSGSPPPRVTWTHSCFKDIQKSSHCTFVYDDQECSLVVLNAQPEDSGVYTCTAKNLAGEISCKAELTVHIGVFGKTDEENHSLRV
uniref:Ig-like domain-containing protein n=1 Tax=Astyanax mexicanus TaxID=7994 RepID=A0A3B1IQA3_ASTMX